MNGHGDDVGAIDQRRRAEGDKFFGVRIAPGFAAGRFVRGRRDGGMANRARHIAPHHFDPIEEGHQAVIVVNGQGEVGDGTGVGDDK